MESKVVQSVGISANSGTVNKRAALLIQEEMAKAVLQANAEGISTSEENSAEIRGRMMAARARVLAQIRKEAVRQNEAEK